MAADPRLLLAGQVPDIGASFGNALLNVQRMQQMQQQQKQAELDSQLQPLRNRLLQAQITGAEQKLQTPDQLVEARQRARLNSVADFSVSAMPGLARGLKTGDFSETLSALQQRRNMLVQAQMNGQEVDTTETDEALAMLQADPERLYQSMAETVQARDSIVTQGGAGIKAFAPIPNQEGGLSIPAIDPTSGQVTVQPIPGSVAPISKTQEATEIADIEINKARRIAEEKQRATRTSEMRSDFTNRLSAATRAQFKIEGALKLAEVATQGVAGNLKLQAAKVFPGIDASNEAQLNQAFLDLAVENLQRIGGPTTDFEFGKMEDITGALGDSQSANIARLKSNQRQAWFARREAQQFNEYMRKNGDPDLFSFNFNEEVQTRLGPKRLVDIRDTAAHYNMTVDELLEKWGAK